MPYALLSYIRFASRISSRRWFCSRQGNLHARLIYFPYSEGLFYVVACKIGEKLSMLISFFKESAVLLLHGMKLSTGYPHLYPQVVILVVV